MLEADIWISVGELTEISPNFHLEKSHSRKEHSSIYNQLDSPGTEKCLLTE